MKFTKMHGIGNDYIYVNALEERIADPSALALKLSDRHFGIGSDGLVLIHPSQKADFRMQMLNSDGSEAEMCGNAIRCVGKFVYDKRMTQKETITIETLGGIKTLVMHVKNAKVASVRVNMGQPILVPRAIPVADDGDLFVDRPIMIDGKTLRVSCVSMGNPHAVTYVDDVYNYPVSTVGPLVEKHELFLRRINTEFVQILDRTRLRMRVWERGAGETLACGTGACAVVVATILNGLCERRVTIELLGGELDIEWNEEDGAVYMTGSATQVFEGTCEI